MDRKDYKGGGAVSEEKRRKIPDAVQRWLDTLFKIEKEQFFWEVVACKDCLPEMSCEQCFAEDFPEEHIDVTEEQKGQS